MRQNISSHSDLISVSHRTEMESNFFSWDEMRSNLCEMKASDFISTLCQNQNETRSWWNKSFHLSLIINLNMSKTENCFLFLILFYIMQLIKFICNFLSHSAVVAHIINNNNQKISFEILFKYNFFHSLFQILIIIIVK